jgi:hypothetical protein
VKNAPFRAILAVGFRSAHPSPRNSRQARPKSPLQFRIFPNLAGTQRRPGSTLDSRPSWQCKSLPKVTSLRHEFRPTPTIFQQVQRPLQCLALIVENTKRKEEPFSSSFDKFWILFRDYTRASRDTPMLKAFCRVAPSVRFSFLAILPAVVFFRASVFRVRTSSAVQERRFPFFMNTLQEIEVSRLSRIARRRENELLFRVEEPVESGPSYATRNTGREPSSCEIAPRDSDRHIRAACEIDVSPVVREWYCLSEDKAPV